jgi:isocitrate dehydrogenase
MYWARALADQTRDRELSATFAPIAQQLEQQEKTIVSELNGVQGRPVEIGGYYHPDPAKTATAMRPSPTLNRIIDSMK